MPERETYRRAERRRRKRGSKSSNKRATGIPSEEEDTEHKHPFEGGLGVVPSEPPPSAPAPALSFPFSPGAPASVPEDPSEGGVTQLPLTHRCPAGQVLSSVQPLARGTHFPWVHCLEASHSLSDLHPPDGSHAPD